MALGPFGQLVSDLGLNSIVPFCQDFMETDRFADGGFDGFGGVASGLVDSSDDIHGGLESGRGRRFTHQRDASFQSVK